MIYSRVMSARPVPNHPLISVPPVPNHKDVNPDYVRYEVIILLNMFKQVGHNTTLLYLKQIIFQL